MKLLTFTNYKSLLKELEKRIDNKKNVFLILNNYYEVKKLLKFSRDISLENELLILPEYEEIEEHFKSKNHEDIAEIYKALTKIAFEKNNIIVLPKSFLEKRIVSKKEIKISKIEVKKSEQIDLEKLTSKLIDFGYTKEDYVYNKGEFSKRGDILDIFTFENEYPFRVSFEFEEIEKIKEFSIKTQESFRTIEKFEVLSNIVNIEGESYLREYIDEGDEIFSTNENSLSDHNNFINISVANSSLSIARQISKEVDNSISIIEENDYVVHEYYGICKFLGIRKETTSLGERDYFLLLFSGGDTLYIPVENSSSLKKYFSYSDDINITLSKRSSVIFRQKKEKVREDIRRIANELIKIYAKRKLISREPYKNNPNEIRDFEDTFIHEETIDQIDAIKNVKEDMLNRSYPMDRLILGDVGFGKTEVAIRAMFIALNNFKQVAFLCPTTILSKQHFNNITKRFENYPYVIKLLTSKTPPKEAKKIKEGLKEGSIDLIIGTHSLLSKTISYKNLSLLIIDEEQKFGVFQKEKIKKIYPKIDILSLSATPIPRTLSMSLSGIYDFDLLMTPPDLRLPIKTYHSTIDFSLINVAIENELKRGGQVFLITYRKNLLEFYRNKIAEHFKDEEIGIIHGGFEKGQGEDVYIDFLDKKINILIGTTVLESGLDIGTLNTIIILNAEHFGLSTLHQLRGRVGRSYEQGYCFLFYKGEEVISDVAKTRINAIEKFSEFGAGYKIANKDLEVRGSGNILGKAQSGHILEIGYELYNELLSDEIERLKGDGSESINEGDSLIKLPVNYLIPDSYIDDYEMRVYTYNLISKIGTEDELKIIREKLEDRFGKIPKEADNLLLISLIKNIAKDKGIRVVDETFIKKVTDDDVELLNNVKENVLNC